MSRAEWALPARLATTATAAALAFGRGVEILIAEHSLAQRAATRAGLTRQRLLDMRALYLGSGPRRN
jgi:hypothetical protein